MKNEPRSRRDWLKLFGVGALIAPIIGAKTDESAIAQLIELPRIRPVELFSSVPTPIDLQAGVAEAALFLTMRNGTRRRLEIGELITWGTISPNAPHVEMWFGQNGSPVSSEGMLTGEFQL